MAEILFNKQQLSDPQISFNREILVSNSHGAYCSTTIAGCNTRKYHGLLVVPQKRIDRENYLLLAHLDEIIHSGGQSFHLSTHRYADVVYPEGYKKIVSFTLRPFPKWIFDCDGIRMSREIILDEKKDQVYVVYEVLEDRGEKLEMWFQPLLAFRNTNTLGNSNLSVNTKTKTVENGISARMYPGFDDLFMQVFGKSEFIHNPDWYYQFEYDREKERGYDSREDLYSPGYFRIRPAKGAQIIVSAGLELLKKASVTRSIRSNYEHEAGFDSSLKSFLQRSAQQFLVRRDKEFGIKAGFPWFGQWGRDTFISLPGLTLLNGMTREFSSIIQSALKGLKRGLLPNCGHGSHASYNSVDAPLWLFWSLKQYSLYGGDLAEIWNTYGAKMKSILTHYRDGTDFNIHMDADGLIYSGETGQAVTWMDAVVDGKPVTPRTGFAVEINALWYHAVCFALEAARQAGDNAFEKAWSELPARIESSFARKFWLPDMGYLADVVGENHIDTSMRPNQIIAISLPHCPVNMEIRKQVLQAVTDRLLTLKGLRTLETGDPQYKGIYSGDQRTRDSAYHQGTVWPWLLGHYTEALLDIKGDEGAKAARKLLEGFEQALSEYGLGQIPEVYDGDEPHRPGGCIAQAWSVAELLRMHHLLDNYRSEAGHELKVGSISV